MIPSFVPRSEATAVLPSKPPVAAPATHRPPRPAGVKNVTTPSPAAAVSYEHRKRQEAEARKVKKEEDARRKRLEELEARIADREQAIKQIEASMSAPGFYDDHESAKPVIDRHQALMWEVGDLMNQWEALQTEL